MELSKDLRRGAGEPRSDRPPKAAGVGLNGAQVVEERARVTTCGDLEGSEVEAVTEGVEVCLAHLTRAVCRLYSPLISYYSKLSEFFTLLV